MIVLKKNSFWLFGTKTWRCYQNVEIVVLLWRRCKNSTLKNKKKDRFDRCFEEGIKGVKLKAVKNLIELGFVVEVISKATGLSI